MKDRLKAIRQELRLTQQEFADRLGVKKNTVSQWESGINNINPVMVTAICREFGIQRKYLEMGEGPVYTSQGDDSIAILARNYGLGSEDVAVIRAYIRLSPKQREAVRRFMSEATTRTMDDDAYLKTSDSAGSGD